MKKIYTITFMLFAFMTVNAQSGYLDYEGYDDIINGGITTYVYFASDRHTTAGELQYVIQTFDSLYITPDYANWNAYDYNTNAVIIDSIFYRIAGFNDSGSNDTLTVSIVALGPAPDYRPTNTVLWTTQRIQNTDLVGHPSTSGAYPTATFFETPNLVLNPGTRFGIKLDYAGDNLDTFGVISGYADGSGCGICIPAFNGLVSSPFYPSAYYKVAGATGLFPTITGAVYSYFDCNCNGAPDMPDENIFQTWSIRAYINMLSFGINDLNDQSFTLSQNSPNPVKDKTSVYYNLKETSKVSLKVVDVVGQEVMTIDDGRKSSGIHHIDLNTSNLKNGVYFYTLTVGKTSSTRRMVVSK